VRNDIMMKAVIVDDERIIRIGIRAVVPWEELGIKEVFIAVSGREALKIIEKEQPDIMITDIQMAAMTGIELIAEIRRLKNDIKIIVLTGYDEFDYARECLRLQVQEFLLKPVDENVLIETINKQVQAINNTATQEQEQGHLRRIAGASEQMQLEAWMRKLIKQEEVETIIGEMRNKYHYAVADKMRIALLLPSVVSSEKQGAERDSFARLTIKNLLIGYLDAQHIGITFECEKEQIAVLLFEGEKSDDLEKHIETFIRLIQEECDMKIRIVIGGLVAGFEQIYLSYNDAKYLLEKEKDEYRTLIEASNEKGQLVLFREVYGEIKTSMNANIGNTERVMRVFDTFCAAANSYNITDQYVSRCCFELASSVYYSYIVESGEYVDCKLNALLTTLLSVGREENYEVTRAFLESTLKVEENDAHELINKIKRYINTNLTEDITVSGIATFFYLSPSYFSRLFKRNTGEGCNEYIVRKRIECAKYLLSDTNMKIGKIAQEVGYRDTNYFSLAFKKHLGVSPGQYRDKVRIKG
jgi:Response regulator containing CheY-like receiver domain and AraC-type DNA-binding domain